MFMTIPWGLPKCEFLSYSYQFGDMPCAYQM